MSADALCGHAPPQVPPVDWQGFGPFWGLAHSGKTPGEVIAEYEAHRRTLADLDAIRRGRLVRGIEPPLTALDVRKWLALFGAALIISERDELDQRWTIVEGSRPTQGGNA